MNSGQPQPNVSEQTFSVERESTPMVASPAKRAQTFVHNHLIGTITATVVGSLLLTGISSWNIWSIYRSFGETVSRQFELQKRTGQIAHYDEVLTMSARMAASTGNLQWQERYDQFVPLLDEAIGETLENVTPAIRTEASKTDAANTRLIELETQAFELVEAKKAPEALQLLLGNEYSQLKAQYAEGNQRVLNQIDALIQQQLQAYQQQLTASIAFASIAFPLLLAGWILVLSAVRSYIRERQAAQESVKQSQLDLLVLNSQLQEEIESRTAQEEAVRKDNDQLQEDIIALLDVVATVEEGDLTTQATVNERATGLIADTLNRLIEELGGILQQVATTTRQVSTSSHQQKDISEVVAQNTEQQSQEVMQVLGLVDDVRSFANNAAQQLSATNQSLVTLNTAVAEGQIEIGTLSQDIEVLQQGSDRIVQQMKTLGEFVGLTDQFVHDQGDIAEQTQMLALNAALVAARASEQTDPKKFAAVAQEFESIANQVSQLAQQTNEGLGSLEQRSVQIHRVVADVDADVQRLGGVVDDFTQGFRHTQEVFQTVQDVTGQAVESGETVTQTSQEIVQTSEKTAMTMAAIAQLSTQIASQSENAQQLADTMNQLSSDLLGKVQVFQLPTADDDSRLDANESLPDNAPPQPETTVSESAVAV
ncbi:methyl-accepting chemotaxis protein [Acaryochloris sp. IP29b_bin.148]|uniref:methyl-accepting chemotaxis protein n=1 Tax=Acaryochloris sp. IP29b_bin.148 TaxID=2969218 RepID=UPI002615A217|nr:methyl-accepting chemotaxis protein [Acaryochloris sp. IP29b_bin.148]